MIDIVLDIASGLLLAAGCFFVLIGAIGVLRLPDFYTRMHAAGVTDTLGAELILLAMILQAGFSLVTVKLVAILFFLFFTSPTSTHAVANAAWTAGLRPLLGKRLEKGEGGGPVSDDAQEVTR
ncbi:cation:proton antiporter [Pyruvatibacter mobilis]|uniref:Cation:proton antiporter n=1 Tax=Pyruvatibacter mobilis TaxID=1712261 RepID=A0A845QB60_9HYPH|nr:cation:proton antiporter [Pyruvatibacter mobilis]QJD76792.1 monovalent cation/H(+) antiporter subunit G [Pyruvatibacter mobilis]